MLIDISDIIFLGEIFCYPFMEFVFVDPVVYEYGVGFLAISSRTPCLLEIGFQGIRAVDVDYHSDIGLVDAHTECIGCHNNPHPIVRPCPLALVFDGCVESRMIKSGVDAVFRE